MLTFSFTGVNGTMTESETLTSGMVGRQANLEYSSDFDGLGVAAVFVAGDVCRVVENISPGAVTIPEEVLMCPLRRLLVGLYAYDDAGELAIPTVLVPGPMIEFGADPSYDSAAAVLPVWKNLQQQIGDLEGLNTQAKESLVAAINEVLEKNKGVVFTPAVSESGELSWTNNGGLENPTAVNLTGPQGEQGPQGETGPQGPQGEPGADGGPIQAVQLEGAYLNLASYQSGGLYYFTSDDQITARYDASGSASVSLGKSRLLCRLTHNNLGNSYAPILMWTLLDLETGISYASTSSNLTVAVPYVKTINGVAPDTDGNIEVVTMDQVNAAIEAALGS